MDISSTTLSSGDREGFIEGVQGPSDNLAELDLSENLRRNSAPEFPRKYVPVEADMGKWGDVEPLFVELNTREISSLGDLERWILDRSELEACLSEEETSRDVERTRHTDNAEIGARYESYRETIWRKAEELWYQLNCRLIESPVHAKLEVGRYGQYLRSIRTEENYFGPRTSRL